MSTEIGVLMPLPLNGMGVGYTCSSLAEGMADRDLEVTVVTPRNSLSLPSVRVIEALPNWAKHLPYRWVRSKARQKIENRFLSCFANPSSQKTTAAYLWPDAKIDTIRELKRRNITIFREQFNCHTGTAKRILDEAYEHLGVKPAHGITAETIENENRILESVDYVFCPSPMVKSSLLENGVDPEKLLKSTYGWDPSRLSGTKTLLGKAEGITAVFVGTICVRKGAHLLLEYWAKSGIKGRLVLAGEMEPAIKQTCADLLAREDVVVLDYFRDIGALYRSADIFLFPSFEEGSPLVIYEACGAGLPIVTTSMGAGRIIRDAREGFVRDAYDADGWIAAIRALANDAGLRKRMSIAAVKRAQSFIWPTVARQRHGQILDAVSNSSRNARACSPVQPAETSI